ncbi:hypothetical protein A7D00_3033 [Trichophyton violaceum]|uniref:Aminoglycoside phosphotransferase domain-containing protein n=1 Tax=Trichophyton violaceum TaxID=34388 RepID=A0A178FME1_TRIVO|nr:hypothetical protein A7D00_3033 [Trichophyton violaceum]
MEYVRKHTTIPIPTVYKAYGEGDYQNLLLERVPGQDLAAAWGSLTAAQKTDIVRELAGYVSQLRQLRPPKESVVGSLSLDSGYDHRLGSRRFGPFSLAEFHKFVRRDVDLESWEARDEIWEYTKIYYGFREFRKDFYSEVEHFFTTYPEELDAEQAIWVITGPFDYDPVWTVVTAEQQRLEIEAKARAKPEIGNSEA